MTQLILELFPDEIIIDIFEYFDIRDLYQSFYGLNFRLNRILQSQKNLSLTFSSPDEMDDEPFFDLFTTHIIKLIVDHSSYIDFQLFSSLHSLILNSPSNDQLDEIYLCKFPYLIHLEFGIMSNTLVHRALNEFLHCKQYPSLQTCIFHHENNVVSSNRYRQIWSNSSTLRTIWLNSIDLSLCSDNELINREKIFSIDVIHLNLKRFDICCVSTGPSIVDIDHFLQQTPNLERFKIASNEIYYSYEFLQQLALILQRRLVNLEQFDCELLCVMATEEIDHISQLHPCFNRIKYQLKYGGQCIRLFTE